MIKRRSARECEVQKEGERGTQTGLEGEGGEEGEGR